MKKIAFFLFYMLCSKSIAISQSKTNIILIFADNLGYMDVGFNGTKLFETPNLDALSKQGMVFPNAYAGAGNCAPS